MFRRRLQVRLDSGEPALSVIKSEWTCLWAFICIFIWTMWIHCGHFRHAFQLTDSWSEFPAVKQGVGLHAWVKLLVNITKYDSHFLAKHHVSGRIEHLYLSKKLFTINSLYIPGYWVIRHSWQKRRIKWIKESFFINTLHKIFAISTHHKRFPDDCN